MTTVLLTGFEPFGGDARNPSAEAVELAAATWDGPERVVAAVLPTEFAGSVARIRALLDAHAPAVVIATGLAANRAAVSVERVAVNLDDARIPDNAGAQPIDEPALPGAPAAMFSGLPVKAIVAELAVAGVPAELSATAGSFVCNHLFFHLMAEAERRPGTRAGFVHVPAVVDDAGPAGGLLGVADLARALVVAARTTLDTPVDSRVVGGAIS